MRVHIVNPHLTYPDWSEGALTREMVERARAHLTAGGHEVTVTAIEEGYDAATEVDLHVAADVVILQTPINWFGAPWIYKRYVDEVFNEGLHSMRFLTTDGRTRSDPTRQYGTGGHLHGRGFFVSATWNAPSTIFDDPDGVLLGGKSLDDLLLGISTSYRFVGFDILDHYGLHDIFHEDVADGIDRFAAHLDAQLATRSRRGAR